MAEENKIVIRVFEKDAQKLRKIFGQPQWEAFRKAIAVAPCTHPEAEREYSTATLDAKGRLDDLNAEHSMTLIGFRCRACGNYVFPDAESK